MIGVSGELIGLLQSLHVPLLCCISFLNDVLGRRHNFPALSAVL